ncbi:hypothetical protein NPIL_454761 [Nephila pilipes]|uniref:Uncharacterized protein n=1 Tax=Nephila pilipes TaxID=299642 RepID=A0A8X6PXY3_NEPPI|nr:hypothetical protein NPIL_454761 [Nephila pilipes]
MIIKHDCFDPWQKLLSLITERDGKIRTVKHKMQHGTVLRTMQRIYRLEIYSKESVDRELGGEKSSSKNVTDNENHITFADDE